MDPKASACQFTQKMGISAEHHLPTIQDGLACWRDGGRTTKCMWHKGQCCMAVDECHLYVSGPPCSPFTTQRAGRFKAGNS